MDYPSPIQGRATPCKQGDLDSRAKVRIAQELPKWMAGIELGLSVKADRTYPRFLVKIYTRGILKNILLRNNLNFQESCK